MAATDGQHNRDAAGGTVAVDIRNDVRALVALGKRDGRTLLLATLGAGMVAALAAYSLPDTYTATALILPPVKPQSITAAILGQLGGIGANAAAPLGLKDPAELYTGILGSRTSADAVVAKLKLEQAYQSKNRASARKSLLARSTFGIGRDSMIRIAVKDTDPNRAAAIANAFVAVLNDQNSRLATTESGQRRLFFERELEAEKLALAAAEQLFAETQRKTGVVELGAQAQTVIGSIAQLEARIATEEAALRRLQLGATAQNPEVARQQAELSSLHGQLARLQSGSQQRKGDPLVSLTNVPRSGLEYARALRELKYHESLYELLSRQFQAARIDEAREAPVIQVVDPAVPPEERSGPPRTVMSLLGAALGGLAALGFVLYRHRGQH